MKLRPVFLLLILLAGCRDTGGPGLVETSQPNPEETLLQNCRSFRDAAIAFAADNDGVCASGPDAQNLIGNTVEDYLTSPLVNPYTGDPEPSVWWASGPWPTQRPTGAGQLGYMPTDGDGDGTWDGFMIEGISCYAPDPSYVFVRSAEGDQEEVAECPGSEAGTAR
jgi:hypothetical protein